jgi:hypothetical protein
MGVEQRPLGPCAGDSEGLTCGRQAAVLGKASLSTSHSYLSQPCQPQENQGLPGSHGNLVSGQGLHGLHVECSQGQSKFPLLRRRDHFRGGTVGGYPQNYLDMTPYQIRLVCCGVR